MTNATTADPRVKRKTNTWLGFAVTYIILLVLAAGQAMIFSSFVGFDALPIEYIFALLGYWALVSAGFILMIFWQKRKSFDKPMRQLSEAARHVARGDFNIYLEPLHLPDKADYLDVMFEDFNKMVEGLASTDALKDDFIADVSHELKTPLAIISNYATILQDDTVTSDERREYASNIAVATGNLSSLVTNILKLNKLENAGILPEFRPFDITQQLAEVALTYADAIDAKNIDLAVDMEDKAMVVADRGMLEIVWANLLSNAVKFTPVGGSIKLTQTSDVNTVTVAIQDTGCGMDDVTLEHVFEKFYQGDTSHSDAGNGLGLALTRRVIELTGAALQVVSEPDEGSTFTVRLKTHL